MIVEIQHVKRIDFFDQFLYYHLIGSVEQIKTHSNNNFPKAVYTMVVVTEEEPFREVHIPPFSIAVSDMEAYNEFDQPLGVYPHRLVFLNPRAKTDRTPESVKGWLALIEDSLDEDIDEILFPLPIFQKVIEEIRKNNVTPDELTRSKTMRLGKALLTSGVRRGVLKKRERLRCLCDSRVWMQRLSLK